MQVDVVATGLDPVDVLDTNKKLATELLDQESIGDLDRLLGDSLSDYVRVYANCPVLLTRIES